MKKFYRLKKDCVAFEIPYGHRKGKRIEGMKFRHGEEYDFVPLSYLNWFDVLVKDAAK